MRFLRSKQSSAPTIQRSVFLTLPQVQTIDVEFTDITYIVKIGIYRKETKRILNNVSGQFNSGELTGIMGPSGAGKSSLLHILTGFIDNGVTGSIRSNGRPLSGCSSGFRNDACYVMHENYLQPHFTVLELMTISANLKIGCSLSTKAKKLLVEDTLDELSLSECRNTKCLNLSGGEAKRLSIALELVDNPPVMFLDEPTTGLDSVSAQHCMKVLKSLAQGGRTIVCTIHQPCASILELLDQVYVLNNGQCVYQGTSYNMLPYLRQFDLVCPKYHNPADFMMEVVNGDHGPFNSELLEGAKTTIWRKPEQVIQHQHQQQPIQESGGQRDPKQVKTMVLVQPPKEIDRFWILLKSCFIQLYRDWKDFQLKLVIHIILGITIGLMYFQIGEDASKVINNVSLISALIIYISYTTLIPAAISFPMVRDIVSKENFNNWYQLKTYFSALIITGISVQFVIAIINVPTVYILSGQPMELIRFSKITFILFLCALAAEGFGFLLGTFCRATMSTFFGALYLAFVVIFGGSFIFFGHMPSYLYWLTYFSYFSYGFDAIISVLYSYNRKKLHCPEKLVYCYLEDPKRILDELSIPGNMYWIDVGILFGIIVLTRIVTYYSLKKVLKTQF